MLHNFLILTTAILAVDAHIAAWHKAMFCLNGLTNEEQLTNRDVAEPLYNLSFDDFWMHGKCKDYPPPDGEYLELPVGGKAQLEHAGDRGLTTLSWDGKFANLFPDKDDHPEYDNGSWDNSCISAPNLHTENATRASGTVLAIAYKSDIHDVKQEDMVVISVLPNTPWHRVAEYDIPADLPACDDCICAFSWIPNHCGQANMNMNAFRCRVTGARPDAPKLAKPVPAKWCEGKPDDCVKGAKQITIYHQQPEINTVDIDNIQQADGHWASPGYNEKTGFYPGAQNDIFETSDNSGSSSSAPSDPNQMPMCNLKARSFKNHRRQRRRLLSFGGFHLYADR